MTNQILKLWAGFLFLTAFCMSSCAEDKGNYTYDWRPKIEVTYPVFTDSLVVSRGQVLVIDNMKFVDHHTGQPVTITPEDYIYKWEIQPFGIKETVIVEGDHTLNAAIFAPVSNNYHVVMFMATHRQTGELITTTFRLRVTGPFADAFVFLTEDEQGNVELELYGNDAEGKTLHQKDYLAGNSFPYTTGGAKALSYDAVSRRIFISTGSGGGYLTTPDFQYDPLTNNFSDMVFSSPTPTFVKFIRSGGQTNINTSRAIYGFTEDGEVLLIWSGSMTIFAPNIGIYGTVPVEIAPMLGTYGPSSAHLLWDRTHKKLVYHFIEYSSMARTVSRVPDVLENLQECVHLGGSAIAARRLLAVVRDAANTYWRLDYNVVSSVPVAGRAPKELIGTASLGQINHWINSTAEGYLYAIAGQNTIYGYVEDQTGVGTDQGWTRVSVVDTSKNPVTIADPVTFTYRERNGNGMDACFWIGTYSPGSGSRIYRLTPGEAPTTLILEEMITTEAKVMEMCYFWG